MKVIEIVKTFRNGNVTLHKIVPDVSDAEIDDIAAKVAEEDGGGHNYGYQYVWSVVTDKTLIHKVMSREFNYVDKRIRALQSYRNELQIFSQQNFGKPSEVVDDEE